MCYNSIYGVTSDQYAYSNKGIGHTNAQGRKYHVEFMRYEIPIHASEVQVYDIRPIIYKYIIMIYIYWEDFARQYGKCGAHSGSPQ